MGLAVDLRIEDERHHGPDGDPGWSETHYFDFCSPTGDLGGSVRISRHPNLGVVWYWACLVGAGRPLVTVIDDEVPLPPSPASMEIRTDGLWADHNIETPFEHASIGLEAFGVALDDPAEVYRGAYGDRTPLGFDMEWEREGDVSAGPNGDRYEIPCRVHGEILVGPERIDFDGFGHRGHAWGRSDWSTGWCWTAFRSADGTRYRATTSEAGSDPEAGADRFDVRATFDAEGLPGEVRLSIGGVWFTAKPLAASPVPVTAPDGSRSRLARVLCQFTPAPAEAAGATGHGPGLGWIEFNQPQMPV
jgi:hypothetical protein